MSYKIQFAKEKLIAIKNGTQKAVTAIENKIKLGAEGPALVDFGKMYNDLIAAGACCGFTEDEIERTANNLRD